MRIYLYMGVWGLGDPLYHMGVAVNTRHRITHTHVYIYIYIQIHRYTDTQIHRYIHTYMNFTQINGYLPIIVRAKRHNIRHSLRGHDGKTGRSSSGGDVKMVDHLPWVFIAFPDLPPG